MREVTPAMTTETLKSV